MRIRRKLMAHLETWRPYTSFYPGLLALSAAILWQQRVPDFLQATLIFTTPILGWLAGLYGCDYFDRDLDAIEKPHRPIPSGRISAREAFICMMGLMYLGFVASAWLSFGNLLLAGAVMVSSVAYTIAKSHAILGNVSRGIPGALTVLFALVAVNQGHIPITRISWLLLVPLLFLLHDMTTNLVGAIRDIKGDRAGNCQTIPVRYGIATAIRLAWFLAGIYELLVFFVLPLILPVHLFDYIIFALCALLFTLFALTSVARHPEDRSAALRAHKFFVIERLILAGAMLAAGAGVLIALLVVVPVIALVEWSQYTLRNRHEFGVHKENTAVQLPTSTYQLK